MSMRKSRQSMSRLKALVNELSDRDDQLKKDFELFEEFFENFPIPVTMWSITKDKTIISQRGNGFACQKANNLEDMFLCPVVKEMSLERHEQALRGEKVDYFVKTDEKVYFAKLVPRQDLDGKLTGVSGIAWDVTSNAIMLACIETIHSTTQGRRGEYREIYKVADKGIISQPSKASIRRTRRKLMSSDGQNGWNEYSRLVLKELETLAEGQDGLRDELQAVKQELTKVHAREDKIDELRQWKEKIDEVTSPTQMRDLIISIEELKTFKTKAITVFAVVQFTMAASIWIINVLG